MGYDNMGYNKRARHFLRLRERMGEDAAAPDLEVNAGGVPGPSVAECEAYAGSIKRRLLDAGFEGAVIYDDVSPNRQLANWHSRRGDGLSEDDFMAFWSDGTYFFVSVNSTAHSGERGGGAYTVPPMDELTACCADDSDVNALIPDGSLVLYAEYSLYADRGGDRHYLASFEKLDDVIDYVVRPSFRGAVGAGYGVRESLDGEGPGGDGGLEVVGYDNLVPGYGEYGDVDAYVHDGSDASGDEHCMAVSPDEAEDLIRDHRGERAWVITMSDGGWEEEELSSLDSDYRRVMTYEDALSAWQRYPLGDEARAAREAADEEDGGHYEAHLLLNYAEGLDTCDEEDDEEWMWDRLIPVADRYVLIDDEED